MANCPKCGSALIAGIVSCSTCGCVAAGHNSIYADSSSANATTVAWESASRFGIMTALMQTISDCLLNSSRVFAQIQRGGSIFMAWAYGILLGSTGLVCNYLWSRALSPFAFSAMETLGFEFADTAPTGSFTLVVAPLIISANIIILSFYCQIILRLFSRVKRPFAMLFRTVCYAQTPALLQAIPLIGSTVSAFWSLYLVVAGTASIYRLGRLRTLALLLFPIFAISIALAAIAIAFAGAGLLASSILKDIFQLLR